MTTNQQRAQLHNILDTSIDIENQGIGKVLVTHLNGILGLMITISSSMVYNDNHLVRTGLNGLLNWLSKVATGNLSAIPGYIERLEKMEAEEMEKYNKLKEKYGQV